MTYVIAAVLLVVAAAVLTLPWSRRDPAGFSTVELGCAWRGPRGAVIGALSVLAHAGVTRRSQVRGVVRTDKPLPPGLDQLTRVVYGALGVPRGPSTLLELPNVGKAVAPVADRVTGAGLRVGAVRRVLGTAAAALAPMITLVALGRGEDLVTGIAVGVVGLVVAGWLVSLRGVTIAGARTLAAARSGAAAGLSPVGGPELTSMPLVLDWNLPEVISADYGSGGAGDSGEP